jgi:hypothetical protein
MEESMFVIEYMCISTSTLGGSPSEKVKKYFVFIYVIWWQNYCECHAGAINHNRACSWISFNYSFISSIERVRSYMYEIRNLGILHVQLLANKMGARQKHLNLFAFILRSVRVCNCSIRIIGSINPIISVSGILSHIAVFTLKSI